MLKARLIPNTFYRLRSQAIVAVFSKTGKRRGELAKLKRENVTIEGDKLVIDFTLEKKKRHFKLCPKCLTKDRPTRNSATAQFCKKCGLSLAEVETSVNSLQTSSIKRLFLDDPLVKKVTEYLDFLDGLNKKVVYLYPASRAINGTVVILQDVGLKGRQLYNLIHALNSKVWPHLFRETVGGKIVLAENSLAGLFKVMSRLDLENLETAQHYVKRWAGDIIERES